MKMGLSILKNTKSIYTRKIFKVFTDLLKEMTQYIIDEKGLEVISEIHQKDYKKEDNSKSEKS